jgi:hypothetical protein
MKHRGRVRGNRSHDTHQRKAKRENKREKDMLPILTPHPLSQIFTFIFAFTLGVIKAIL